MSSKSPSPATDFDWSRHEPLWPDPGYNPTGRRSKPPYAKIVWSGPTPPEHLHETYLVEPSSPSKG